MYAKDDTEIQHNKALNIPLVPDLALLRVDK